jgi:transcriptional regulator GlxA family with amidase domain
MRWRTVRRVAATASVGLVAPVAVGAVGIAGANAAEVLASAGLLDGRPATSHWLALIGLWSSYPAVRWQDGVRYVDDGDLITTAGVLSGVDGALRVVERMLGPAAVTTDGQPIRSRHGLTLAPRKDRQGGDDATAHRP